MSKSRDTLRRDLDPYRLAFGGLINLRQMAPKFLQCFGTMSNQVQSVSIVQQQRTPFAEVDHSLLSIQTTLPDSVRIDF